jgi:hypothetical protein
MPQYLLFVTHTPVWESIRAERCAQPSILAAHRTWRGGQRSLVCPEADFSTAPGRITRNPRLPPWRTFVSRALWVHPAANQLVNDRAAARLNHALLR